MAGGGAQTVLALCLNTLTPWLYKWNCEDPYELREAPEETLTGKLAAGINRVESSLGSLSGWDDDSREGLRYLDQSGDERAALMPPLWPTNPHPHT